MQARFKQNILSLSSGLLSLLLSVCGLSDIMITGYAMHFTYYEIEMTSFASVGSAVSVTVCTKRATLIVSLI